MQIGASRYNLDLDENELSMLFVALSNFVSLAEDSKTLEDEKEFAQDLMRLINKRYKL
ncbi:hypothetical protein [Halocella sp. SP3-1]|uniref:hypothetical protein n=1 Tax=Halocella sp. SP3-1 TaxID=2382161 RepID=UPI0013DF64C1|nr:hypothetical protein [Halocella sp. SP3-1]